VSTKIKTTIICDSCGRSEESEGDYGVADAGWFAFYESPAGEAEDHPGKRVSLDFCSLTCAKAGVERL
jgi:hypothetical protein